MYAETRFLNWQGDNIFRRQISFLSLVSRFETSRANVCYVQKTTPPELTTAETVP